MISSKPELTLPHRKPFLWVHRLVERNSDGTEGVVEYDISADLELFKGHFPGNPVFPGVLQMEASGQGCIWVRYGELSEEWIRPEVLLVAATEYKFKKPVVPPATLRTHVWLEAQKAGMQMWKVQSTVNDVVVSFGKCWMKMSEPRRK